MAGESLFGFPDSGPVAATNMPFYLFGRDGRCVVRCRTRWMADNCVYVVAPLGTARAVKQRWQASAFLPGDPAAPARQRRVNVELVSAESLLGSDSGMEGLLLRMVRSEDRAAAPPAVHPAVMASAAVSASPATVGI